MLVGRRSQLEAVGSLWPTLGRSGSPTPSRVEPSLAPLAQSDRHLSRPQPNRTQPTQHLGNSTRSRLDRLFGHPNLQQPPYSPHWSFAADARRCRLDLVVVGVLGKALVVDLVGCKNQIRKHERKQVSGGWSGEQVGEVGRTASALGAAGGLVLVDGED